VIAKPTIFVLGAGASAPYGFPTAKGLFDLVYAIMSADSILLTVLMECDFSEDEILTFCRRVNASGQDSIRSFDRAPEVGFEIGEGTQRKAGSARVGRIDGLPELIHPLVF
jgi:hypothetical protein